MIINIILYFFLSTKIRILKVTSNSNFKINQDEQVTRYKQDI